MRLHQGDCIRLRTNAGVYQVIGIDDDHYRCWVREWPLTSQGSPVFEVPFHQITPPLSADSA